MWGRGAPNRKKKNAQDSDLQTVKSLLALKRTFPLHFCSFLHEHTQDLQHFATLPRTVPTFLSTRALWCGGTSLVGEFCLASLRPCLFVETRCILVEYLWWFALFSGSGMFMVRKLGWSAREGRWSLSLLLLSPYLLNLLIS